MTSSSSSSSAVQSDENKKLLNPDDNRLNRRKLGINGIVARDGLNADPSLNGWIRVLYAHHGFPISVEHTRKDHFPGTIIYYFEIKQLTDTSDMWIGLSDGNISLDDHAGDSPNSYVTNSIDCHIDGHELADFLPDGTEQLLHWNDENENIVGCGLLLDSNDNLAVFFTLNGQLMGNQIPIEPTVDTLFPTIEMMDVPIRANFDGPFEYKINECPGLDLD